MATPTGQNDGLNPGNPNFSAAQTNPFNLTNAGTFSSPTLVDLDGDGDLDALIGVNNGNTIYFENTGNATNPTFAVAQTNPFNLTNAGTYITPTFIDLDGDEDLDAYILDFNGNKLYFENTGNATNPSFATAQTNPFNLTTAGLLSSPTFIDLDGDGDLDALISVNGSMLYFQNTGNATNPTFAAAQTNPFNLTTIGSFNHPTFADIDNDGDLDAVIGAQDGNTYYFENTGNATNPAFAAVQTNPSNLTDIGSFSRPTFADIDGDGDLDAVIGASDGNLHYFENVASLVADPAFTTEENKAFTTGNVLSNDTDPDNDPLIVLSVNTTGTQGLVTNNNNGTFGYNPNGAFDSLADGETATDTFTYTISDGNGGTDTATVTITITGVTPLPPSAQDDGKVLAEGQANPFNLADIGAFSSATFIDIDGDGDLDAFIGENDSNTIYFENTGNATNPTFAAAQTNPFNLIAVGTQRSTPTFADLDGDGDFDAFIGSVSGNTNYFENTGNSTNPAFAAIQSNPFNLVDVGLFSDPTFADLDGDGDLDAVIGNQDGDQLYFQNTGNSTNPAFATAQTNPFNLTNVGSGGSPTFVDWDDDGDLDAFIGNRPGNTLYFENTGNSTNPTFATPQTNPFNVSAVIENARTAVADLDGDGDKDLFIGGFVGNTTYYEKLNTPTTALAFKTTEDFTFTTGNVLTNDTDPNGDTLTVLSINTTGTQGLVTNNNDGTFNYDPNGAFNTLNNGETGTDTFTYTISDGFGGTDTSTVTISIVGMTDFAPVARDNGLSPVVPNFAAAQTNPFNLTNIGRNSHPTLADLDGDGDLDALVGEFYGNTLYFENTGTHTAPAFGTAQTNPFGLTDVGLVSAPILVDIDGDRDLDAFLGEQSSGNTLFFENTGNRTNPAFSAAQVNPFGLTGVGTIGSEPTFADLDGDGDLDALIGALDGNLRYFENTGSEANPAFAAAQINPFNLQQLSRFSAPDLIDLDHDGDLDALIGDNNGNTVYFENTGSSTNPAFAAPQTNPFNLTDVGQYAAPTFADLDGDGDLDALIGERYGSSFYFENTAALVLDPAFTTDEFSAFTTGNVLSNDSDLNGDNLTILSINTTGTQGIVTNNNDGTFDYDPNGAFAALNFGQSATDTFTYTISDGKGGTDTATVTVTINGVNEPPTADADAILVSEDAGVTDITATLLNGDTDPNNDTLTITSVNTTATTGSVTLDGLGNVSYNPTGYFDTLATGETAPDTFTYTVSDGNGATSTATVTLTITGSNDAPIARDKGLRPETPSFAAAQTNPFNLTDVGSRNSPTLADLDGDGDLDAIIGNSDGNVLYFRNIGNITSPTFAIAQTNPFNLIDVGTESNPVLADLDGDGDLDAVIGETYGNTLYFENTGNATQPTFAGAQTNPFNLTNVGFGSHSTFADLDGDGDFDAIIGNSEGNTLYFENTGNATNPAFAAAQTNPFNLTDVGFTNAPVFIDLDSDGDLDGVIGDSAGNLRYFENTGSTTSPDFATAQFNPFNLSNVTSASAPAIADLDGDGDLDALIGNSFGNVVYFENNPALIADSAFTTEEGTTFTTGNVLDNDTDIDSGTLSVSGIDTTGTQGLVTNNNDGTFSYDPNGAFDALEQGETATDTFTYTITDGSGSSNSSDTATVTLTINGVTEFAPIARDNGIVQSTSSFAAAQTNPYNLTSSGYYAKPTFADLDGDGDLDLYAGAYEEDQGDQTKYYENTGGAISPAFAVAQINPANLPSIGSYDSAAFIDLDGDLDLDMFIGKSDGSISYYENIGNSTNPNFGSAQTNPFNLTDVGNNSTPTFVDLDRDGDVDAVIGNSAGNLIYFENTGDANNPAFAAAQTNPFNLTGIGSYSDPTFADLDGDGDLDALVGNLDGDSIYFENTGNAITPAFASAQTNPFNLANVGSYSSPTFADLNGDGVMDVAISNRSGDVLYFENIATLSAVPAFTTDENTSFTTGNVLSNDSDVNGDSVSVVSFGTTGTQGLVTNNNDGTFGYNPNGQFASLQDGETATDTFTYTISDGNGGTDTASVTITITGISNVPAVITGDIVGTATEAGVSAGTTATGDLNHTDVDNANDEWQPVNAGASISGYGTVDVTTAGVWTYTVDNMNGTVNALNTGETLTDTFSTMTTDGTTQTVTVTINGTNDAAVIMGESVGDVIEDNVTTTATGTLNATDVDSTTGFVAQTAVVGTYGSFTIGTNGAWTYTLDNGHAETNALAQDQTVTDVFNVTTDDGTTQSVTLTITGTNDAAVLGSATVNLTETDSVLSTNGTLSLTDVDSAETFVAQTDTAGTHGSFSINSAGAWSYTASSAHDAFVEGVTYTDSFNVASTDGTTTTVSVNVLGSNDSAVLGSATVNLTETDSILSTNGSLSISDLDSAETFVAQTDTAGSHGLFSINSAGAWSYTASSAHDAFVDGVTYTDSFNVASADGTPTTVTVNIVGTNDAAIITGDIAGAVTEDNATNTSTGTLNSTDIDSASEFVPQTNVIGTYGSFTIDTNGDWSYTLDNDNTTVNTLNTSESLTETFTATTIDGSSQLITVTINGANDILVGTSSNDTLIGGDGIDNITGDGGNDLIQGNGGADTLDGGLGRDILDYSTSSNAVTVNLQTNTASGGDAEGDTISNFERVYGGVQDDSLTGDNNINLLVGGEGADTLSAGIGNDSLRGEAGADVLDGGAGFDVIDYLTSDSGVNVNLLDATATGGHAEGDTFTNVERIYGSNHADILTGDTLNNLLLGRNGADSLAGGLGNDRLWGQEGADTLDGGAGIDVADYISAKTGVTVNLLTNSGSGGDAEGDAFISIERIYGSHYADSVTGDTGSNLLIGRDGDDSISGGEGNDSLRGEAGADVLDGGDGSDTADYFTSNSGVTVNLLSNSGIGGHAEGDTLTNVERIKGSSFSDSLIGDARNNLLIGGIGDDTLLGGQGNDILRGEAGVDSLDGGDGVDAVDYLTSNSGVTVSLADNTVSGGHAENDILLNIERLYGSKHADSLTGDSGRNLLIGQQGADTLSGGEGNDDLRGISGNDSLLGGTGSDKISGGAGNDSINGEAGADTLTGGTGSDTFTYLALSDSLLTDYDVITDFAIGTDSVNGPNAGVVSQSTNVASSLSEVGIQDALGDTALPDVSFGANGAATFSFGSQTFLALNDGTAGYQSANDALIEITGFTGDLSSLTII